MRQGRNNCLDLICFVLVFATAAGTASTLAPGAGNRTSVFNDACPADGARSETLSQFNSTVFQKSWFQAAVTHNSGMFNPVFLPFKFVPGSGPDDPQQRLTFPSLLSFKFDFVPDNFSARHPAFIYRKTPIWDIEPGQAPQIAEYIEYWEATHAFAGTVVQHADGFTGRMLVYDKTGTEILKVDYDTPVPYFTLMGRMVKSWMEFRGQPVSEGLLKELNWPMTKDMECVRLYGQSFTKEWRTQPEWDIYEEILRRDPNFGEVRFWYANQKSWAIDDHVSLQAEKGRALNDHLVISALNEFSNCPDKSVVRLFREKLRYAEEVCSDNPLVMSIKLKVDRKNMSDEQLDRLLPVAADNPCCFSLLSRLAQEYRSRGMYEKSIPLYLSAVFSGYMPGTGSFEWEWAALQEDFHRLGYYNEAILCGWMAVRSGLEDKKYSVYRCLGHSFAEQFHFETAAKLAAQISSDDQGDFYTRLYAHQLGKPRLAEDLIETGHKFTHDLLTVRELAAVGKFDAALEVIGKLREIFRRNAGRLDLDTEITAADICLLAGDMENARTSAVRAWAASPRSRQVACLVSRAFEGDEQLLGQYAAVEAFIFENSAFRESPVALVEPPLRFDRDRLTARFNEIKGSVGGKSDELKSDFWMQFAPFEIEYLCLGLLKDDNPQNANEVLTLYRAYSTGMAHSSKDHQVHSRIFGLQLKKLSEPHPGTAK